MVCEIKITSVLGIPNPNSPSVQFIEVKGTAGDCTNIEVTIKCTDLVPIIETTTVNADDIWNVKFDVMPITVDHGCNCGSNIEVLAVCLDMPRCQDRYFGPLDCGDIGVCPEIVTLNTNIQGCISSNQPVTVIFTGILVPAASGCRFIWDFGDESLELETNLPNATHQYTQADTYAVSVTVICGENCITVKTRTVVIPRCCPQLISITHSVDGCADGQDRKAIVTLVVGTDSPSPVGIFDWDFGDGPSQTSLPFTSHEYSEPGPKTVTVWFTPSENNCPRSSPIQAFPEIPRCEDDGGGNGGGNGGGDSDEGESTACGAARWILVIAGIMTALLGLLAICMPAAASALAWWIIGFGIITVVVGVLWAWFCPNKPCRPGLLLSWQIAFGTGAGALILATCCPTLLAIGLGLIGLSIPLILAWKKACNKNNCDITIHITPVFVGAIIPVATLLQTIPIINACINDWIVVVAALVSAGIVKKAFNCLQSVDTAIE